MVLSEKYKKSIFICVFILSGLGFCLAQEQDIIRQHLDSIANPPIDRKQELIFDSEHLEIGEFPDSLCPKLEFHYRNSGNEPIVITRIVGSCSCLTIHCDNRRLQPDDDGIIQVTYNAKGHIGKMRHNLFVYTDCSVLHPAVKLQLSGNVVSSGQYSEYPIRMGSLKVKRQSVNFGPITRSAHRIERIACINSGTDTLALRALFPSYEWLQVYTEPQALPPGTEGDLILVIDGAKTPPTMQGMQTLKVWLEGVKARGVACALYITMTLND